MVWDRKSSQHLVLRGFHFELGQVSHRNFAESLNLEVKDREKNSALELLIRNPY